jgi:hypothetical protein
MGVEHGGYMAAGPAYRGECRREGLELRSAERPVRVLRSLSSDHLWGRWCSVVWGTGIACVAIVARGPTRSWSRVTIRAFLPVSLPFVASHD